MSLLPNGVYYGWILVGALSLAEMTSWGVLYYTFSVFLVPMQHELGWSRASVAGAFSLALLLSGVAGVPIGRWVDRHGPRLLMTTGSIAATLLVLAWSRVTNLVEFYAIWGGIGIAMAAMLYEPAFAVIAKWFMRRRGRALTVLTFVGGFASVIYIPLAGWLIRTRGWRDALFILACVLAVGTIPLHALVLRRRPEDLGLRPDGGDGAPASHVAHPGRDEYYWSAGD
jgi:MFS family permease